MQLVWQSVVLPFSKYYVIKQSDLCSLTFEQPIEFLLVKIELLRKTSSWPKTALNYRMMLEGYPNLKEEVDGLIPDYEISSLLDAKLARWSSASYALALACRPFVSK